MFYLENKVAEFHFFFLNFLDGTTADIIKQEVTQLNAEKKVESDSGFDYTKTSDEIRKLREEESQLRQENIELKVTYFFNFKF